jgi:ABC-2 type transport system ATP-binding protein
VTREDAATPLLHVRGVVKAYGSHLVLDDVSLRLDAGEVVALVGENGSGKSTLLRICAGVLRPDAGAAEVNGSIGYCPQDPGLLDRLSVDEHLELFGSPYGLRPADAISAGRRLLDGLHLRAVEDAVAMELSGGNRQKLNLALALLGDPDILLLDEPYQGFDHGTYVDFWQHVHRWRDAGKGVLIVTHLLAELALADRIIDLTPTVRTA